MGAHMPGVRCEDCLRGLPSDVEHSMRTGQARKHMYDPGQHVVVDAEPIATVVVPVRTVSELNRHEHWRYRQKRAKSQREVTEMAMIVKPWSRGVWQGLLPLHIHLTRLAPGKLDSDNLAGSQKHVRDAVAKFLGIDDGDESKATWSYAQERQKTYAVRIEFYRRQK